MVKGDVTFSRGILPSFGLVQYEALGVLNVLDRVGTFSAATGCGVLVFLAGGFCRTASEGSLAPPACPDAYIQVGTAVARPGEKTAISVVGQAPCRITGFSLAVGHDPSVLACEGADPGPFFVAHAGRDLVFECIAFNAQGYSVLYVLLDISAPITVPPVELLREMHLATLRYVVLPEAPLGTSILRPADRVFGAPNPVASIYTLEPGLPAAVPQLLEGSVKVVSRTEGFFRRADANRDGGVDIADSIFTLTHLFLGGRKPSCMDSADANDDGRIDISDAIFTLGFLFGGSQSPAPPGAFQEGPDPTLDALDC